MDSANQLLSLPHQRQWGRRIGHADPAAAAGFNVIGIKMFGAFGVESGGMDLTPTGKRARAALAILALDPTHSIERRELASLLWHGRPEEQTGPSQRQLVRELKRHFVAVGLAPILTDRSKLGLDAATVEIDLDRVELLLRDPATQNSSATLAFIDGPIVHRFDLPDRSASNWCRLASQRRGAALAGMLRQLMAKAEKGNDFETSRRHAQALLRLNATHEEAHRALIRYWLHHGDIAAAVSQYETCAQILRRQHDIEPSALTRDLVANLRRSPVTHPRASAWQPVRRTPTLAVLPVVCTGPRAIVEDMAFVVSADLITSLARFRTLSVIGRPASYVYSPEMAMGEEFTAADYRLESRLTHNGESGRLVLQLVSAESRVIIWADQFRLAGMAMPEVDQLIDQIVNLVDRELTEHLATEAVSIHEPRRLWAQADRLTDSFDIENVNEAEHLLREAALMDKNFARAHAGLATVLSMRQFIAPSPSDAQDRGHAIGHAKRAVLIDPWDARNHVSAAWSYMLNKEYDPARRHFELALEHNWSDAAVVMACAEGHARLGEVDKARSLAARAMAAAPDSRPYFSSYMAVIEYCGGNIPAFFDLMKTQGLGLSHFAWLATAYWERGDHDKARETMEQFLNAWISHSLRRDANLGSIGHALDEMLCIGDPQLRRRFLMALGQIHPGLLERLAIRESLLA